MWGHIQEFIRGLEVVLHISEQPSVNLLWFRQHSSRGKSTRKGKAQKRRKRWEKRRTFPWFEDFCDALQQWAWKQKICIHNYLHVAASSTVQCCTSMSANAKKYACLLFSAYFSITCMFSVWPFSLLISRKISQYFNVVLPLFHIRWHHDTQEDVWCISRLDSSIWESSNMEWREYVLVTKK